jgi:NAD+ synthase
LSGGLDSAVVAVLCLQAVGQQNLKCLLLPADTSSKSSIDDARQLCNKFDIKYEIVPIGQIVKSYFKEQNPTPLRVGNFCARVRMAVLYDISSDTNAVVVGTSNRSEILLGYGTIYGDTACAFNPIGNIYKSSLYEFALYLGVTKDIITKKPSADLWSGQTDEQELGYSYKKIDQVLKKLVDNKTDSSQLVAQGFDKKLVHMVQTRIVNNSFKQHMPNIARVGRDI